jgi:hypothetical protein
VAASGGGGVGEAGTRGEMGLKKVCLALRVGGRGGWDVCVKKTQGQEEKAGQ